MKTKTIIKTILYLVIILILLAIATWINLFNFAKVNASSIKPQLLPKTAYMVANINDNSEPDTIVCSLKVVTCKVESTYTDLEYKIMMCESGGNPLAQNPNSTAKGLFQFLDSTWANNCEGDVFNANDNTVCFRKWFPIYPSWWNECL